jgi:hypothetical protein
LRKYVFFWSRNLYLPFLSFILFGLRIYYVMSADFKLCIKCDKLVNILDGRRNWRASLNISRSRLFFRSRQASFVNHTFDRLTFFRCPRFTNLTRKFTVTNSMMVTIIVIIQNINQFITLYTKFEIPSWFYTTILEYIKWFLVEKIRFFLKQKPLFTLFIVYFIWITYILCDVSGFQTLYKVW